MLLSKCFNSSTVKHRSMSEVKGQGVKPRMKVKLKTCPEWQGTGTIPLSVWRRKTFGAPLGSRSGTPSCLIAMPVISSQVPAMWLTRRAFPAFLAFVRTCKQRSIVSIWSTVTPSKSAAVMATMGSVSRLARVMTSKGRQHFTKMPSVRFTKNSIAEIRSNKCVRRTTHKNAWTRIAQGWIKKILMYSNENLVNFLWLMYHVQGQVLKTTWQIHTIQSHSTPLQEEVDDQHSGVLTSAGWQSN